MTEGYVLLGFIALLVLGMLFFALIMEYEPQPKLKIKARGVDRILRELSHILVPEDDEEEDEEFNPTAGFGTPPFTYSKTVVTTQPDQGDTMDNEPHQFPPEQNQTESKQRYQLPPEKIRILTELLFDQLEAWGQADYLTLDVKRRGVLCGGVTVTGSWFLRHEDEEPEPTIKEQYEQMRIPGTEGFVG